MAFHNAVVLTLTIHLKAFSVDGFRGARMLSFEAPGFWGFRVLGLLGIEVCEA